MGPVKFFATLASQKDEVLFLGDFNIHFDDLNNQAALSFKEVCKSLG